MHEEKTAIANELAEATVTMANQRTALASAERKLLLATQERDEARQVRVASRR